MRLAPIEHKDIKVDLTAMIDIVFQLLTFFIMTFNASSMEGDFTIRMPLATTNAEQMDIVLPDLITVELRAGNNGNISSIVADGNETYIEGDMFQRLTDYVETQLAGVGDPESAKKTEVEFDIDFGLKYSYTVTAIEAVSGRVQPDGSIKKLIEKIKFKDNSK